MILDEEARKMWVEYQEHLRVVAQASREMRELHREVREMADEQVRRILAKKQVNQNGSRLVIKERWLRTEIRKRLPYEEVPWYPEFDEKGGQDIPFVKAGLLRDLKSQTKHQVTKKKREPKPSKTE